MRRASHEGIAGTREIGIVLRQNSAREGRGSFPHGDEIARPERAVLHAGEACDEGEASVTRIAMLALAGWLIAGCKPDGLLGTVGAIVTAPITAPVMFVSARMNDRKDHLERARRNHRPLPPIDAESESSDMAQATLEQALKQGRIDAGLYWQNDEDASGYAAGGFTCRIPSVNSRSEAS